MNTLHALAALALVLLPACGGAAADSTDDGIVTVITRYYPPASQSAPSDAGSPTTRHDDTASPMDGDGDDAAPAPPPEPAPAPAPAPAPSPATRDDEVAPAPEVEQPDTAPESPAPAPDEAAPAPDADADPAPELLAVSESCSDDVLCASGVCDPRGTVYVETPDGFLAQTAGVCIEAPADGVTHWCTWSYGTCQQFDRR